MPPRSGPAAAAGSAPAAPPNPGGAPAGRRGRRRGGRPLRLLCLFLPGAHRAAVARAAAAAAASAAHPPPPPDPRPPLLRTQAAPQQVNAAAAAAAAAARPSAAAVEGDYAYSDKHVNVVTVRRSARYPGDGDDADDDANINLDLSQTYPGGPRGQWMSARPTPGKPAAWTIFAAAPSARIYVGQDVTFQQGAESLQLYGYPFRRMRTLQDRRALFPLCFERGRRHSVPAFLPGAWVDRPTSVLQSYGRSADWAEWEAQACYAEVAVHSCFYQNETDRATRVGRRIWQPHGCALLPFNAEALLRRFAGRQIWFEGDSVSIQMFVSLLCLMKGTEVQTDGIQLQWLSNNGRARWNMQKNCKDGAFHCYFGGQAEGPQCVDFKHDVRVCVLEIDGTEGLDQVPDRAVLIANMGLKFPPGGDIDAVFMKTLADLIERAKTASWKLVWRQSSLQHFEASGDCSYEGIQLATPGQRRLCSDHVCNYTGSPRALRDAKAIDLLRQSGVDVLWIDGYEQTAQSNVQIESRTDTRTGDQDCTHFCIPGLPDHWNRLLFNYLMSMESPAAAAAVPARSAETPAPAPAPAPTRALAQYDTTRIVVDPRDVRFETTTTTTAAPPPTRMRNTRMRNTAAPPPTPKADSVDGGLDDEDEDDII